LDQKGPVIDDATDWPAGLPVRADGRRTHERLLAAAQATFAQGGTDASLREVARQAGVSIATLYRHFPTREAVLEALLRHGFDTLHARACDLLDSPDAGRALVTWSRELASASARYDGLPASVMDALHDRDSPLHASCARLRASAADLLARAQNSGQVRADLDADQFLAAVSGMAWAARQASWSDEAVDRFLSLLLEGLATRANGTT
jgi:AcrR family transcriptional regulator